MAETVISMSANLRGEVLRGERTQAWRPGHRDYAVGPATIRFMLDSKFVDQDAPPIDVMLTKVEHTQAKDKYQQFQRFVIEQGLAPDDGDDITLLEWVLVH